MMQEPNEGRRAVPLDEPWGEVLFSVTDGMVWASWPGTAATVKLGRYPAVLEMMKDFIEQSALGEALSARTTAGN